MQRTRPPFHVFSEGAYASAEVPRAIALGDGADESRKQVARHDR